MVVAVQNDILTVYLITVPLVMPSDRDGRRLAISEVEGALVCESLSGVPDRTLSRGVGIQSPQKLKV